MTDRLLTPPDVKLHPADVVYTLLPGTVYITPRVWYTHCYQLQCISHPGVLYTIAPAIRYITPMVWYTQQGESVCKSHIARWRHNNTVRSLAFWLDKTQASSLESAGRRGAVVECPLMKRERRVRSPLRGCCWFSLFTCAAPRWGIHDSTSHCVYHTRVLDISTIGVAISTNWCQNAWMHMWHDIFFWNCHLLEARWNFA